jgi:hypothetical protein
MIKVECSARGADRLLLQLANGWTVGIWPQPDGMAVIGAWAAHTDHPVAGRLSVVGDTFVNADGIAQFLTEMASNPQVKSPVGADQAGRFTL